jgi:hypothetical protein
VGAVLSACSLRGKRGHGEKTLGRWRPTPFNGGGGEAKQWGWCDTVEKDVGGGGLARCLVGAGGTCALDRCRTGEAGSPTSGPRGTITGGGGLNWV